MTDNQGDAGADKAEQGTDEGTAKESGRDAEGAQDTDEGTATEPGRDAEGDGSEATTRAKSKEGGEDRLEALQKDIDEVRQHVGEVVDKGEKGPDQGERASIEEGVADVDQPVDDTIAPPG